MLVDVVRYFPGIASLTYSDQALLAAPLLQHALKQVCPTQAAAAGCVQSKRWACSLGRIMSGE